MNIYDIAKDAGVSIATVSRVLNNSKKVSDPMRKRVEESLARNNYSPNAMARGLVRNSMKTVGVLVADIRHYHHAAIYFTIERELCHYGYNVIMCNTGGETRTKVKYIKMLSEKKVDGIILIGSIFNEKEIEHTIYDYLKEVPVMMTNTSLSLDNAYSITGDPIQALRLGVSHLRERGHTRIAYVREDHSYSSSRKLQGFTEAMQAYGLACDESHILRASMSFEGGCAVADVLHARGNPFTALIFEEDTAAIGAIRRFKDIHVSVPDDVAVIGYDDTVYSQFCIPRLTTINSQRDRVAILAARTLCDILNKHEVEKSVVVAPFLMVRESA